MTEDIELLIEGGKATGGPPLGPALGPMGVNLMEVVNAINEKTKSFAGMQVPVKVKIDMKTKSFDIVVGTPPASALIKKELGIEKGSGHCSTKKAGDLKLEQVKKLAEMKKDQLLSYYIKNAMLEIIGTCVSMGVNIEGKSPKEIQKLIKEGTITV